jgi:3-oxoacyl-[acyl-carrier-protein] synthase II
MERAGLDKEKEDSSRIGCSFGTAAGDYDNLEAQHSNILEKGPGKGDPMAVPKIIPNMSSANAALDLGINGPNFGTASACTSSSHSIALAAMIIQAGMADVMVAGGAESTMTPLVIDSYACMGVLTQRNDDPAGASRPFDRDRDGFLIGEAGATLILESGAHAKKRGAEILAVLAGYGMTSDAYSIAIPEPNGRWAGEAILSALKSAKINLDQVGYVNAHGTSTKMNDITETKALKYAFGQGAYNIPVSSNKSMVGHNLGAAGAIEAAATVLSVYHGIIPPTINYENPDPDCDLDYVPNQSREVKIDAAISNSFGFGGQNGVLVFRSVH